MQCSRCSSKPFQSAPIRSGYVQPRPTATPRMYTHNQSKSGHQIDLSKYVGAPYEGVLRIPADAVREYRARPIIETKNFSPSKQELQLNQEISKLKSEQAKIKKDHAKLQKELKKMGEALRNHDEGLFIKSLLSLTEKDKQNPNIA